MNKVEILIKYENDNLSGKSFGSVEKCIDYIFNSFIMSGSPIKELKTITVNGSDQILIQKVMKLFEINDLILDNFEKSFKYSNVLMGTAGLRRDKKLTQKRLKEVENVVL